MNQMNQGIPKIPTSGSLDKMQSLYYYDNDMGELRRIDTGNVMKYNGVLINEVYYSIRRVIWFLYYGTYPEQTVNISRLNMTDGNNISNLIAKKRKITNPIKKGVWKCRSNKCWCASMVINKKSKTKQFSIEKYGNDNAFEMAKEYRDTLENESKNLYLNNIKNLLEIE